MDWYRTSQTVVIKTYETVWLHNCVTTVVAPTFTVGGYTFRECACGYSYRDAEVRALGHSFVRISQSGNTATFRCTRCGYTYTSGSIPVPTDPKPPIVSFSLGEDTAATTSTTGCGSERVLKSMVTEEHSYIYAGGRLLRETITTTAANGTVTTKVLDFAYEERVRAKKKAELDAKKDALWAEDIANSSIIIALTVRRISNTALRWGFC